MHLSKLLRKFSRKIVCHGFHKFDISQMSFYFLADGPKTYQSWDEKQRINLEQPKIFGLYNIALLRSSTAQNNFETKATLVLASLGISGSAISHYFYISVFWETLAEHLDNNSTVSA